MATFPKLLRFALLAGMLLLAGLDLQQANAANIIDNFHSEMTLTPKGTLVVRETITVTTGRKQHNPGLNRDFPLKFLDKNNREREFDFTILSVKFDNKPENYHLKKKKKFARLSIGPKKIRLSQGPHTYEIIYQINRHIQFLDNHDELNWNVNGNFWNMQIKKASATIRLPEKARIENLAAFTGPEKSPKQNATFTISPDGHEASISTAFPLGPNEGLTFSLAFQKGVIMLSSMEKVSGVLEDYKLFLYGVCAVIFLLCYYMWFWLEIGRDPPKGPVVPRWDVPKDISPALAHYVTQKSFRSNTDMAISAAISSLAVKGYIKLEHRETPCAIPGLPAEKSLAIIATGKPIEADLPANERTLLNHFGNIDPLGNNTTIIDMANGSKIKRIINEFEHALKSEHRSKYYARNRVYVIGGAIFSYFLIWGLYSLADSSFTRVHFFKMMEPILLVTFPIFIVYYYGRQIFELLHNNNSSKILTFLFYVFILIPFMTKFSNMFISINLILFDSLEKAALTFFSLVIVGLNLLFYYLMGAPTRLGKEVDQHLEGLRTFLSYAEKERLNSAYAGQVSPQQFERLLPYAIALGVEKPWTSAFKGCLMTAKLAKDTYSFMDDDDSLAFGGFQSSVFGNKYGNMHGNVHGNAAGFDFANLSESIASRFQDARTVSTSILGVSSRGGSSGSGSSDR